MALARPATTVVKRKPITTTSHPAPFSPADFVVQDAPSIAAPTSHIRRCTYRRVMPLKAGRRELQLYEVDCTHPSYDAALPLGHLEAARTACAACALPGTFRPDED
jgi:hypothetical protein